MAGPRQVGEPHSHSGRMAKFQPPTGLTDGRDKYNTPRDKRALFLANKYYKVQSANGRYNVRKIRYHHQGGNNVNLGRAAPSAGRLGGTTSLQVPFLHPHPKDTLAWGDGEQSICRRLNAHSASGRPRDSAPRAGSQQCCGALFARQGQGNPIDSRSQGGASLTMYLSAAEADRCDLSLRVKA
jgi:hypothetical protein